MLKLTNPAIQNRVTVTDILLINESNYGEKPFLRSRCRAVISIHYSYYSRTNIDHLMSFPLISILPGVDFVSLAKILNVIILSVPFTPKIKDI